MGRVDKRQPQARTGRSQPVYSSYAVIPHTNTSRENPRRRPAAEVASAIHSTPKAKSAGHHHSVNKRQGAQRPPNKSESAMTGTSHSLITSQAYLPLLRRS